MTDDCPTCRIPLTVYPDYLYCFRCSKQFKRKLLGKGLKEVKRTIEVDQSKALSR
ncbi:MAG: hypothetical protein MUC62_01055 [Candidatus Thermoplasmatota archaeon]|nr:hypothetical protein [Candidatus Thermoplasmatota archaeon]